MKVEFNWDRNACMTNPNQKIHQIGSIIYTTYDLDGRCNCGKRYSEHPHFVKSVEETHAKYAAQAEQDRRNDWEKRIKTNINKEKFDWNSPEVAVLTYLIAVMIGVFLMFTLKL